ncbi:hypothetical protein B0H10DRAFT_2246880, partial [Mycena sp. CBHHK59/15]
MTCVPPFYPSPGHKDTAEHDRCSQCVYYVVWAGFVRGIYTNLWIARHQTERFTYSRQKSFKKRAEAEAWWMSMCTGTHQNGCPAFEARTFTLNPNPATHPTSAPCTVDPAPESPSVPVAGPSSSRYVPPPAVHVTSPARATTSATSTMPMAAPSPFSCSDGYTKTEPASPTSTKKEEPSTPNLHLRAPPRVTPLTRVQLTPTGVARGAFLAAECASAAVRAEAAADIVGASVLTTPAGGGARRDPVASVLVTPAAQPVPAPAPAPWLRRAAFASTYGIRGVAVFYSSHAAARAAVERLGLDDSKIMVSDNIEKLEAWMTGEPFLAIAKKLGHTQLIFTTHARDSSVILHGQETRASAVHEGSTADYIEASKKSKNKAKTRDKQQPKELTLFWQSFFFDYWQRFPWRVPLSEDPPPPDDEPPADAEGAFKALELDLTPEEEDQKSKTQSDTKLKIKRWFSRQRPGAMGVYGNPYFTYLLRMRRQEDEPPPKWPTDFQFYMRHPYYKEGVADRFEDLYGDEPRSKHIALRCKVAREMLAEEPEDVRERVKV